MVGTYYIEDVEAGRQCLLDVYEKGGQDIMSEEILQISQQLDEAIMAYLLARYPEYC